DPGHDHPPAVVEQARDHRGAESAGSTGDDRALSHPGKAAAPNGGALVAVRGPLYLRPQCEFANLPKELRSVRPCSSVRPSGTATARRWSWAIGAEASRRYSRA